MATIKPGGVVMRRSGDPSMTVKFIERSEAACAWIDDANVRSAGFALSSLEPVAARDEQTRQSLPNVARQQAAEKPPTGE
jgi:uncharacterized protein YodC (DUF2158 family)